MQWEWAQESRISLHRCELEVSGTLSNCDVGRMSSLLQCTYCSQKCGTARFTAVNLEGFQENKQDRSQERRLLSAPDNKGLFCVLSTCTGFLLTFTHQTQTETRIKHDSPPKKDGHTGTITITRLQSPALKTHNFWQHLHRLKQF